MKFIIFILILFLNLNYNIKFIHSFELILKIDFNSLVEYNKYECGGSLNIYKENYQSNKTINYPPCKSFSDAGFRSQQFFNQGDEINYNNVSLIFLIQNPSGIDWRNYTIVSYSAVTIRFFCFFEVRFEIDNDHDTFLTIDGENTIEFLNYQGYTNENITCDPNKLIRIKLSNIIFKNWKYGCLNFYNNPFSLVDPKPMTPTIIELSSIKTEGVFSFISSDYFIKNVQINLIIKDCIFDGMNETNYKTFIHFQGMLDIFNCTFKNIISNPDISFIDDGGIIVINNGDYFKANKIEIFNIKFQSNFPFFNIYIKSDIDMVIIENSYFSNFLTIICGPSSTNCSKSQFISNFTFRNNQIKFNLLIPPYITIIRVFKILTPVLIIENVTIESNNQIIEGAKQLFEFSDMNVKLKNIQIPNNPQFSVSIASDKTKLEIDNNSFSLFNSKNVCFGSSNNILISVLKNETEKVNTEILKIENEKSCKNCNISYIILQEDICGINNQPNNGYNKYDTSSFNNILIIPIVLSVFIISIIIICSIIFRKKIKQTIIMFKNKNNENESENENNGDVDHDTGPEMDLEAIYQ